MRAAIVITLLISTPAFAAGGHTHQGGHGTSPYADLTTRSIKALSNAELEDLRAGKGMGMALPAELNGYPGPVHVLELADTIALTPEQRHMTHTAYSEMKEEAQRLGNALVDVEAQLDELFRDKRATADEVQRLSMAAATVHGQLRATHLKYHLRMVDILRPDQITLYQKHRGYR